MRGKDGNLKESPSQTAGPYVHIGCTPNFAGIEGIYERDPGSVMIDDKTKGDRITITGCIHDGAGAPLTDAMVEIWQADSDGLFVAPGETRGTPDTDFSGWGRQPSDQETGVFTFETIKPGPVPFADGRFQAPHIMFWITARGINIGLHTRLYFEDEASANKDDPVLLLPNVASRAQTLIATKIGSTKYRFDIHLQGENETLFFDI